MTSTPSSSTTSKLSSLHPVSLPLLLMTALDACTENAEDALATDLADIDQAVLSSFHPEELYISRSHALYAIDGAQGNGYRFLPELPDAVAMIGTGPFIYEIRDASLRRLDTVSGAFTTVQPSSSWAATEAMTALGDHLYIVDGGTLWRVNVKNGAIEPFSAFPTGWQGTEAMAGSGDSIYAIQQGTLWRVNVNTRTVEPFSAFPTGWQGTEAMTARHGVLYAVQGGALWKVSTASGSVVPLGTQPWDGTTAMAGLVGLPQ